MSEAAITVAADDLTAFVARIFEAVDVEPDEARLVAESLVLSNLVGHDSHGVMRVDQYVDHLRNGELVSGAPLTALAELPGLLATDAHLGFGQVQMRRLIERLILKTRAAGIACGTVTNCGHVGRLGEWVETLATEGLASLLSVNDNGVLRCVAPPGGIEPRISTNPIAVGIPTTGDPLVLDISTSSVANGKIRAAYLAGRQCPPGWMQDTSGNPTTDPAARLFEPLGALLPMGGAQGYKGFGLGLVFDMLVAGMSGGYCPPAEPSAKVANNVLLVAWNPERFAGREHFVREAERIIDYVRSATLQPGVDRIRLPGDRSRETRMRRAEHGIPLDDGTWQTLTTLAGRLRVHDVPGS